MKPEQWSAETRQQRWISARSVELQTTGLSKWKARRQAETEMFTCRRCRMTVSRRGGNREWTDHGWEHGQCVGEPHVRKQL